MRPIKKLIKSKSLAEFIIKELEDKIVDGTLKPGERIIEEDLCKTYGISRSPVREALRILESQKLIKRQPRKGVMVTKITPKEAEDIYRIRSNLESLATYLAVKNHDHRVLKKLKKIHSKMNELAANGKVSSTYFNLNLQFHKTLVNASGNQRLIQMIETFVKQTKRYRFEVLSIPGRIKASLENHEGIIRSFEEGDADKAEQLRKSTILMNIKAFSQKFKEEESE
jgi:DNA-binding GntR family transcriptional regulator